MDISLLREETQLPDTMKTGKWKEEAEQIKSRLDVTDSGILSFEYPSDEEATRARNSMAPYFKKEEGYAMHKKGARVYWERFVVPDILPAAEKVAVDMRY